MQVCKCSVQMQLKCHYSNVSPISVILKPGYRVCVPVIISASLSSSHTSLSSLSSLTPPSPPSHSNYFTFFALMSETGLAMVLTYCPLINNGLTFYELRQVSVFQLSPWKCLSHHSILGSKGWSGGSCPSASCYSFLSMTK